MKKVFIYFFVFFPIFSFGQKKAIISELKNSGGILYQNGTPFTGLAFEMYNETQFKKKINLLNGKPHGKGFIYFNNGQIEFDMNFMNGKEHGKQLRYRKDGSLSESENYSNGKKEGKQILYHNNGNIWREENFKNGRRDGKWMDYYENGKIRSEKNYNEGIQDGRDYELSEDGKIWHDRTYVNGNLNGKEFVLQSDFTYIENNYINGNKDGIQIFYNKNGKKQHEENYINGKLDGKEIRYNEDYVGGISEETNYKNGKRDGKYIRYFQDGRISEEINYKDGIKNGIWIKYRSQKDYGNYTKEFESYYKDDKRDGVYTEYDNDGKIETESYYKEGLLDGKKTNYVYGKVNSVFYFQNGIQIENKPSENKTNECSSFVLSAYDSAKNNIEKDKKFKYYFEQAEQYIIQEGEKSYNAVVNLEQAIYLLEKGDVFTTKVGELYSNLANCYRIGFKCYEKALYYYKKVPSSSFGKKRGLENYNIAICYYELNNFEEMRKYLQNSKSSGWDDDFYKLSDK